MQDYYILQNPHAKRTREDALAGKKPVPPSLLVPAQALHNEETGISVFDDQSLKTLMQGGKQDDYMDPRIVEQLGLRNGDLVTLDENDCVLAIHGIPIQKFVRAPYKFAYPIRRLPFFDRNPILAPAIYKAPWGFGQRGVIIAKPGKGKSTYGWEMVKEACRYTLDNENFRVFYISVDERHEDSTEGEDIISSLDHRPGSVMTFSLPVGISAASQWYQTWYACEIAESMSLCGFDCFVIIDAVSRLLASITDPDIPKPKNDPGIGKGTTKYEMLTVRSLVLAKGGRVRFGPGSYTAALIMLTGDDNWESLLWNLAGPAIETSTIVAKDIGIIDIEATRTRQVGRFLGEHDPFTSVYRRMELMRTAQWSEPVTGKTEPYIGTPNYAEQFRRHDEMVKAVLAVNSHAEQMMALATLAKKWNLLVELDGSA